MLHWFHKLNLMKNIALLFFALFVTQLLFAQANALKLTNTETEEVIIIPENKRVRVKTVDGKKYSGRFTVQDSSSILVDKHLVTLDELVKIKRHPLVQNIIVSSLFIWSGLVFTVVGLWMVSWSGQPILALAGLPGVTLTYFGFTGPNLKKAYKVAGNWKYELVTINKS